MPKKIFSQISIILILLTLGLTLPTKLPRAQDVSGNFILAWSSDSYLPPGYPGRALPSRLSRVRVTAMPVEKLTYNPDQLSYRWLLDEQVAGRDSGPGKSAFTFTVTKWGGDSHEVQLQILDLGGNVIGQNSLLIPVVEPQTLLVASNENYAAQDTLPARTGQEINLLAAPLFFAVKALDELNFEWNFDGQTLTSADQKNLNRFTLKIPAGNLVQSLWRQLKLYVSRKVDELQQSSNELMIEIK